jgi:dimeric dUTPase (all-alpha-NTP-PPase superfamily)
MKWGVALRFAVDQRRQMESSSVICPLRQGGSAGLLPPMDKLEEVFRLQAALNARIGVRLEDIPEEEQVRWVLNYTRAMQQELAELVDSVPWKWWARYQQFDRQNARVEVIDLFHFLVSLAQTLGMSADDVYQAYLKKNTVNLQRQESGYSDKDEDDSRHI